MLKLFILLLLIASVWSACSINPITSTAVCDQDGMPKDTNVYVDDYYSTPFLFTIQIVALPAIIDTPNISDNVSVNTTDFSNFTVPATITPIPGGIYTKSIQMCMNAREEDWTVYCGILRDEHLVIDCANPNIDAKNEMLDKLMNSTQSKQYKCMHQITVGNLTG